MFLDSSHYKNYNDSCVRYLSKILSKLRMCDFKTFSLFAQSLFLYFLPTVLLNSVMYCFSVSSNKEQLLFHDHY